MALSGPERPPCCLLSYSSSAHGVKTPQWVNLARCDGARRKEVCAQLLLLMCSKASWRLFLKHAWWVSTGRTSGQSSWSCSPPTVQPHVWCSDFQLDARQSVSPAYFVKGYTKLFLRCCWPGLTHPICLGCVKWAHFKKKTTLRTGLQFVQRMKEGGRTGWKNKPFRVPISGSGRSSFVLMGELALGCYGCPIPHLPHQSPLMGLK